MVASGPSGPMPVAWQWIALVGGVVMTTVQMQDMHDQPGDEIRGRKTVPPVIGDAAARWTVAVPVFFWSLVAPAFWGLDGSAYNLPAVVGLLVSYRVLFHRSIASDERTVKGLESLDGYAVLITACRNLERWKIV